MEMTLSPSVHQPHKPLFGPVDSLQTLTASIVLSPAPEILPLFFADSLQLSSLKVSVRSEGKMMCRSVILLHGHEQVAELHVRQNYLLGRSIFRAVHPLIPA